MKKYFVAGTDTGVGKTLVTAGLLHLLKNQGYSTLGYKPIASGCEETSEGLRNEDALLIQQAMSQQLHYDKVNPISLKPAVSPHFVWHEKFGQKASMLESVMGTLSTECQGEADYVLYEGAGGWRCPLDDGTSFADIAKKLNLEVILVVGLRLGCLNHALLTAEAILKDGLQLSGWVASCIDQDLPYATENFEYLVRNLPAPCLGKIPYLQNPSFTHAAKYFDQEKLTEVLNLIHSDESA